jgi:dihydroflavonol-4-reductase
MMMNGAATSPSVLVTGGNGYLGRWCVRQLLQAGYSVRTTVRDNSRIPELRSHFGGQDRLPIFTADLRGDEGWKKAVSGCDYVLHVASPFPAGQPKDPDELIGTARDGTLRVLEAAFEARARRVVVTSSSAAVRNIGTPGPGRPLAEDDWADPDNPKLSPYARSKTLAERAAWEYAGRIGATDRLTVINPGAIIGPLLGDHRSYSIQTVERLLTGSAPAIPRLGYAFVDVRDAADLHIRAMSSPQAAGQRFLGTGPFTWMADIAAVLRQEFGPRAPKVPKRIAPNTLIRLIARFDQSLKPVIAELGQESQYSTEKARRLLGWSPRPTRESILDCATSILAGNHDDRR